ncbi:MAG: hypothetical protein ABL933_17800 [Methyloglobulus sp.]|nr:hypothetical protein [Methyloglobulus sp.]
MILSDDVRRAERNWNDWISVFEHEGEVENNPLLTLPEVFNKFLAEYSVRRTIRAGTSNEFRMSLSSGGVGLADKLGDPSGKWIDNLEEILREDFGTLGGKRGMRSVISKIAAFLGPANFVAWDKYARKGIIRIQGKRTSHTYKTYEEYLSDVNIVFDGEKNALILACQNNYPTLFSSENDRFHRRVLDVYLMRIGGRWR